MAEVMREGGMGWPPTGDMVMAMNIPGCEDEEGHDRHGA